MTYSIASVLTTADGDVLSMQWSYKNPAISETISVGGNWKFAQPPGTVPISAVDRTILEGWFDEQCPNTTEQFDEQIEKRKAAQEQAETDKKYTVDDSGKLVPVTMPAPTTVKTTPKKR